MYGKGRNQSWRQKEETSLITSRGFIWLPFKVCKYDTTSLHNSLVVLPDLKNTGIAVLISLISCIEAEITLFQIYFRLISAIFDLSFFQTWDNIRSSLIGLPDLENMGIAVGISFLSCIEAKICDILYLLPVNDSHL